MDELLRNLEEANTPAPLPDVLGGISCDQFLRMTYKERCELRQSNPALFHALLSACCGR